MNKKMLAILAIVAAVGGFWFMKDEAKDNRASVRVVEIKEGSEESKIQLEGVVVPEAAGTLNIYADFPVVIEKIEAQPGNSVKKGDLILTFTEESKREAEKIMEEINIQLESSENQMDSLNRQINMAKHELELLRRQAAVNRQLFKEDAISSLEVERSTAAVNRMESTFTDLNAKREIDERKLSQLREKHGEMERKFKFVKENLRAPKSGTLTFIPTERGVALRDGQKLVSISEEGSYEVFLEAPANLVNSINEGDLAKIRDVAKGTVYDGKVIRVSRIARDNGKNNKIIDVEVQVDKGADLNPGFLTVVEIVGSGMKNSGKMADAFSVVEDSEGAYVFTVVDDTVVKTPVKIGMRTATKYELPDLPEGTEIVVNPAKVNVGDRVRVIK